jgi:DNA excision repair protein ERCC-6
MAGIAGRQGLLGGPSSSPGSSRSGTPSGTGEKKNLRAKDFERMIPEYIKRHGGQVPSKLLVDHFNHYCTGPRLASEFKAALDRVAKMEKRGSSGRAIWTLKSGF